MTNSDDRRDSGTVLIVEDHTLMRQALREFVQDAFPHCDFREAADGASALDACDAHTPKLILMDIGLPDADGIELTSRLKTLYPETHVIIVSYRAGECYARRAFAAGARAYVVKEHISTDLVPAVAEALGTPPTAIMGISW